MRNMVQTVDRALRILQSFEGDGDARSVSEIASRLGGAPQHGVAPPGDLAARRFLERAPDGDSFHKGIAQEIGVDVVWA
jgi:DNA-binding IclR family transcriptional regulator